MTYSENYIASAGQTYVPFSENIHVKFPAFDPPAKPEPPLPELTLTAEAIGKGYVLPSQKQHFLPGVTEEMMDWFWANMEKCYYLWAPGSHKRFNWVKTPAEYGIEESVHMIAESCGEGLPVFGGNGVEIHRLHLREFYPFETALKHVSCEGVVKLTWINPRASICGSRRRAALGGRTNAPADTPSA